MEERQNYFDGPNSSSMGDQRNMASNQESSAEEQSWHHQAYIPGHGPMSSNHGYFNTPSNFFNPPGTSQESMVQSVNQPSFYNPQLAGGSTAFQPVYPGGIGNASVSTMPGAANQPIDNLTQQFDQISLQQPSTSEDFDTIPLAPRGADGHVDSPPLAQNDFTPGNSNYDVPVMGGYASTTTAHYMTPSDQPHSSGVMQPAVSASAAAGVVMQDGAQPQLYDNAAQPDQPQQASHFSGHDYMNLPDQHNQAAQEDQGLHSLHHHHHQQQPADHNLRSQQQSVNFFAEQSLHSVQPDFGSYDHGLHAQQSPPAAQPQQQQQLQQAPLLQQANVYAPEQDLHSTTQDNFDDHSLHSHQADQNPAVAYDSSEQGLHSQQQQQQQQEAPTPQLYAGSSGVEQQQHEQHDLHSHTHSTASLHFQQQQPSDEQPSSTEQHRNNDAVDYASTSNSQPLAPEAGYEAASSSHMPPSDKPVPAFSLYQDPPAAEQPPPPPASVMTPSSSETVDDLGEGLSSQQLPIPSPPTTNVPASDECTAESRTFASSNNDLSPVSNLKGEEKAEASEATGNGASPAAELTSRTSEVDAAIVDNNNDDHDDEALLSCMEPPPPSHETVNAFQPPVSAESQPSDGQAEGTGDGDAVNTSDAAAPPLSVAAPPTSTEDAVGGLKSQVLEPPPTSSIRSEPPPPPPPMPASTSTPTRTNPFKKQRSKYPQPPGIAEQQQPPAATTMMAPHPPIATPATATAPADTSKEQKKPAPVAAPAGNAVAPPVSAPPPQNPEPSEKMTFAEWQAFARQQQEQQAQNSAPKEQPVQTPAPKEQPLPAPAPREPPVQAPASREPPVQAPAPRELPVHNPAPREENPPSPPPPPPVADYRNARYEHSRQQSMDPYDNRHPQAQMERPQSRASLHEPPHQRHRGYDDRTASYRPNSSQGAPYDPYYQDRSYDDGYNRNGGYYNQQYYHHHDYNRSARDYYGYYGHRRDDRGSRYSSYDDYYQQYYYRQHYGSAYYPDQYHGRGQQQRGRHPAALNNTAPPPQSSDAAAGDADDRRSVYSEHSTTNVNASRNQRYDASYNQHPDASYHHQWDQTNASHNDYSYDYSGYSNGAGQYGQYNQQQQYHDQYGYGDVRQEEEPKGRQTPAKFMQAHPIGRFGPGGHFLSVLPNRPNMGQPAVIEVHSVETLLEESKEAEECRLYPGPLDKRETHKNDVLQFCQRKAAQCLDVSDGVGHVDRHSAALIYDFIALIVRHNAAVNGTDVAELVMKDHDGEFGLLDAPEVVRSINKVSVNADKTEDEGSAVEKSDPSDRFRELLLYGRKKEALGWAMKNGLWGHALLLASKIDAKAHSVVMLRFANSLPINDPLQTLYQLMSGQQPASVTSVAQEEWGSWRPHLAMILSNGAEANLDLSIIMNLGNTLSSKGLLDAAHFCYLMAKVPFGRADKTSSKLVLIGADHTQPFDKFATDAAIRRTELYEYAVTCGSSRSSVLSAQTGELVTVQSYKLIYAARLMELGMIAQAFHYCELLAEIFCYKPQAFSTGFAQTLTNMVDSMRCHDARHQTGTDTEPRWIKKLHEVYAQVMSGNLPVAQSPLCTDSMSNSISSTPFEYEKMASTPSHEVTQQQQPAVDDSMANSTAPEMYDPTATNAASQQPAYDPNTSTAAPTFYDPNAAYNGQATEPSAYEQQQQQQMQNLNQQEQSYGQSYGNNEQFAHQPQMATYEQQATEWQQQQQNQPNYEYNTQQTDQQQLYQNQNYNSQNQQQPAMYSSQNAGLQQQADPTSTNNNHLNNNHSEPRQEPEMDLYDQMANSARSTSNDSHQHQLSRDRTTSESSRHSRKDRTAHKQQSKTSAGKDSKKSEDGGKQQPKPATTSKIATEVKKIEKQSQSKEILKKPEPKKGGWLGWIFGKGKNQVHLPDDSKTNIIWDKEKNRWVDTSAPEEEEQELAPPPMDPLPAAPTQDTASSGGGGPAPPAPPAAGGNRFSLKGRGRRSMYRDAFGGSKNSTAASQPSIAPPSSMFPAMMPSTDAAPPNNNFFVPQPTAAAAPEVSNADYQQDNSDATNNNQPPNQFDPQQSQSYASPDQPMMMPHMPPAASNQTPDMSHPHQANEAPSNPPQQAQQQQQQQQQGPPPPMTFYNPNAMAAGGGGGAARRQPLGRRARYPR